MNRFLNISEKANIILHALAYMGAKGDNYALSVTDIAQNLNVSKTYLAKILQEMVKNELLISTKGAKGGFFIKRKTLKMNLYKILTIIDGEFPKRYCFLNKPVCKKKSCVLKELNERIAKDIKNTLSKVNLDSLIENFKEMEV